MRVIAAILLVAAAVPAFAEDKSIAGRWSLKLVPDRLPALPDDLYDRTWANLGFRSPAGDGHDDYLTFHRARDGKPAQVEWKQVVSNRFNRDSKTTTRTLPLRVDRALLEYDDHVQTAIIDDGKLLLNVAVPVAERTWYLVYFDRFSDGTTRICEWLFAFADDPGKQTKGRLTVKHYRNLFPQARPEQWDLPATFEVRKDNRYYRELYLRHDNKPGEGRYRLPGLYLWAGKTYASVDEHEGQLRQYR